MQPSVEMYIKVKQQSIITEQWKRSRRRITVNNTCSPNTFLLCNMESYPDHILFFTLWSCKRVSRPLYRESMKTAGILLSKIILTNANRVARGYQSTQNNCGRLTDQWAASVVALNRSMTATTIHSRSDRPINYTWSHFHRFMRSQDDENRTGRGCRHELHWLHR